MSDTPAKALTPTNKVTAGMLVGAVITLAVEVATTLGFDINATMQASLTTIALFGIQWYVPDQ